MRITKTKVTGLKELGEAFKALTHNNFRKKALMAAGRHAMKPMLAAMERNAPMLTGENLKKNPNFKSGDLKTDFKYSGRWSKQPLNKSGKGKIKRWEYWGRVATGKKSQSYIKSLEYGRKGFLASRDIVFGKKVNPYHFHVRKSEGKPFIRQTFHDNKDKLLRDYISQLKIQFNVYIKKQAAYVKKQSKLK